MIRRQFITGLLMTVALTVVLGVIYPLAMTVVGQVAFKDRADGSLVRSQGRVVGSLLLGQGFSDAKGAPLARYFQPRPSAAGKGSDALASGSSNLGPSNPKLIATCEPVTSTDPDGKNLLDQAGRPVYDHNPDGSRVCDPSTVPQRVLAYRAFNDLRPNQPVPVDAVTASGSGLDPHISVANAQLQARRVATSRNLPPSQVESLIRRHTEGRQWGFLGERAVNVLELNVDLDGRS